MRRLLYVPVMHDGADMGSAGVALEERSAALSGKRRWTAHKEVSRRFWEGVAALLRRLDARQMRVYQDGLAAGGEAGHRIVREAALRGSRNYQVVLELLQRGAELRKTEDPALLMQEHASMRDAVRGISGPDERSAAGRIRPGGDPLMEARDRFMAATINATLQEGEVGVLFVGAYHDVARHLDRDISVEGVKEPALVQAYFRELFWGHDDARLEEMGRSLAPPTGST